MVVIRAKMGRADLLEGHENKKPCPESRDRAILWVEVSLGLLHCVRKLATGLETNHVLGSDFDFFASLWVTASTGFSRRNRERTETYKRHTAVFLLQFSSSNTYECVKGLLSISFRKTSLVCNCFNEFCFVCHLFFVCLMGLTMICPTNIAASPYGLRDCALKSWFC
jgi:hypothetical protein